MIKVLKDGRTLEVKKGCMVYLDGKWIFSDRLALITPKTIEGKTYVARIGKYALTEDEYLQVQAENKESKGLSPKAKERMAKAKERMAKARAYDLAFNEGGEGYNPYRN